MIEPFEAMSIVWWDLRTVIGRLLFAGEDSITYLQLRLYAWPPYASIGYPTDIWEFGA